MSVNNNDPPPHPPQPNHHLPKTWVFQRTIGHVLKGGGATQSVMDKREVIPMWSAYFKDVAQEHVQSDWQNIPKIQN